MAEWRLRKENKSRGKSFTLFVWPREEKKQAPPPIHLTECEIRQTRSFFSNGAGGGSRTHMKLPSRDFESLASAISPHQLLFIRICYTKIQSDDILSYYFVFFNWYFIFHKIFCFNCYFIHKFEVNLNNCRILLIFVKNFTKISKMLAVMIDCNLFKPL